MSACPNCEGAVIVRGQDWSCPACSVAGSLDDMNPQAWHRSTDELQGVRNILNPPPEDRPVPSLTPFPEVPFSSLPVDGIQSGLHTIEWKSHPQWCFVMVSPVQLSLTSAKYRSYTFMDHKGRPQLHVQRLVYGVGIVTRKFSIKDGAWHPVA